MVLLAFGMLAAAGYTAVRLCVQKFDKIDKSRDQRMQQLENEDPIAAQEVRKLQDDLLVFANDEGEISGFNNNLAVSVIGLHEAKRIAKESNNRKNKNK